MPRSFKPYQRKLHAKSFLQFFVKINSLCFTARPADRISALLVQLVYACCRSTTTLHPFTWISISLLLSLVSHVQRGFKSGVFVKL